jgi:hypothetical protein
MGAEEALDVEGSAYVAEGSQLVVQVGRHIGVRCHGRMAAVPQGLPVLAKLRRQGVFERRVRRSEVVRLVRIGGEIVELCGDLAGREWRQVYDQLVFAVTPGDSGGVTSA